MLETQGRIDTQPRFRCINHDKKGMVLDFESVRVQRNVLYGIVQFWLIVKNAILSTIKHCHKPQETTIYFKA